MSCGRPHATACGEVLRRVYEYLDGEMAPGDLAPIRQHLDECTPCLREYGLEESIKSLVRRSCASEPVPQDLRERVLLRVREVSLRIDYRA